MRIIDTGITREMLSGDNHPQIKILDKCYTVDDRQKTFEKIQEVQKNTEISEKEKTRKIYELALGVEATEEILALDLSVQKNIYLSYCIMGAITGEEPDKLMQEARKN